MAPLTVRRAGLTLVVAILGSTMAFLDSTVVNVALPVMQASLEGSAATMQWIVEAYALMLASLVLVGGALGDRLGRKRVFVAGVLLFTVASAACGAAPTAALLVAARAVQGIGAALLVPGSLSLITAAFPDDHLRARAIGTWSSTSAITGAVGPVLGGWLVTHTSWRWIFLINLPIGAIVVALALGGAPETKDENAPPRIDVVGAALAIVGLGLLVFGLLEAPSAGALLRSSNAISLALGVAALALFLVVEARQSHPMVPLTLFRSPTFAGTNLLTLLLYAAMGGGLFFLPFNLIQVHGYAPSAAGAALLPLIGLISLMSPWIGRLAERYGPRTALVLGPLVAGAGFAALALPDERSGPYWTTFFPGIAVLGLGMGVTVAPLTTAVMGAVDSRHAGVASGINNAVARVAGLLAIAALGVVVAARFDHALDGGLDAAAASPAVRALVDAQRSKLAGADLSALAPDLRPTIEQLVHRAFVDGFRTVMLICAGLAVAGGAAAAWFVRGSSASRNPSPDR